MANRHLARSVVLQTLFEWDFNRDVAKVIPEALTRNAQEFAPGMTVDGFMEDLIQGVLDKQEDIDTIITKAAPEWPLEKISVVDRNILRIGLFELLFGEREHVPAKVAINEAVELAKTFGGETSSKFINGVLGAVYKELGEPGKDETGPKKKRAPVVPYEKMPIEKKGGGVVYSFNEKGEVVLALIHDIFGHWTLSKSSVQEDETVEEATIRAFKKEMGLDIEIVEKLGENEYIANHPEKGKVRKQVTYFLGKAPFGELTLGESGGLDDVRWFALEEVPDLNLYADVTELIAKSVEIIKKELDAQA